ncbi:MAG TPA: thioredoxin family protein [Pyrinomonadaceae bacterium]
MSFTEYIGLIDRLLAERKTTGPNQSGAMFNYGKINRQRMARIGKTLEIETEIVDKIASADASMTWLIITEGWCGDAAQNIPVIEKLAEANHRIETRYILRDANPELMDQFLTEGSRSIPKLIAIDNATAEVLGTWGPRPEAAQGHFREMKAAGIETGLIHENLRRWYLSDRGRSIQFELAELVSEWSRRILAKAA